MGKVSSAPKSLGADAMLKSSLSVKSVGSMIGSTCFWMIPRVCLDVLGD